MRRFIGLALGISTLVIIGLIAVAPQGVKADRQLDNCVRPGLEPLRVLEPVEGTALSIFQTPEFRVSWTCVYDALWYQVRIYMPDDENGQRYVEFRYNPDEDDDWQRDQPSLLVATGLLDVDAEHQIVVAAYGGNEKFWSEYDEDYYPLPTGLDLSYYEALTPPSEPVTIRVLP